MSKEAYLAGADTEGQTGSEARLQRLKKHESYFAEL
jgi:hypothetical protein